MQTTQAAPIKALLAMPPEGQQISTHGWVRSKRQSKAIGFCVINDGSCQQSLQLVIDAGTTAFERLGEVQTGAAISVTGSLKASGGKGQSSEVVVEELQVIGQSTPEFPLQKKGHSLEFLRDIAHLRPRTNTFGAVFRIRNALAMAIHTYLQEQGYYWVHTPVITNNDCEGAGEAFAVETPGRFTESQGFFGQKAYLTVSGQLEAEYLALGMGKVYTFGPAFRAENSNTTRHLAELWMLEPEIAFADLDAVTSEASGLLSYVCQVCIERCSEELAFLDKTYKTSKLATLKQLAQAQYKKITYTQAIEVLQAAQASFETEVTWGIDLQTEHERFLAEQWAKGPVIVTDYPKDIKSFYMRLNEDKKTVAAMDLLVPGVGELMGGSAREERLEVLVERMEELNIPRDNLEWYLDLRRFGTAPHGGFGLGFDRLVMYVTGMENIRDTIPSPRTRGLLKF